MKNTWQTLANRYPKLLIVISALFFVIILMSFITYDKYVTQASDKEFKVGPQEKISSVSMVDGNYKIDTKIILTNRNKQTLLADLDFENLMEKKTKEEIPDFILSFMESVSENKKFDMANPGEPWCVNDIMGFTLTKMYDSQKKDTVDLVSPGRRDLPGKQLAYFGIGKSLALLSYYSGGIRMTQHIVMIRFEGNRIVDFWSNAYFDLTTATKAYILERLERNGTC